MNTSKTLARAVVALSGLMLWAAPPLTTVRDTIYRANGSAFTGKIVIEWRSFEASDTSFIAKNQLELQITEGFLNARLVPTTTATNSAYYRVRYYSSNGTVEFSEAWAVPPSADVLRVRNVRIQDPLLNPGALSGGNLDDITIADVDGLDDELTVRPKRGLTFAANRAAVIGEDGDIESAIGDDEDCVRVNGTASPCGGGTVSQFLSGSFVDGQLPAGSINGSNTVFTLSQSPNPVSSLLLYRNGLLQKRTLDYSLSGSTITFLPAAIPQTGDVLIASYRTTGTSGTIPQTLCSKEGTVTGQPSSTSLGTCEIPGSALQKGDRVEISFDFAHAGATVGYSFQVKWGNTVVATHSAPANSTAGTGRVSLGIYDGGAQWSSQNWGNNSAMTTDAGNSTEVLLNPLTVDFRGQLASASTDTITLRNLTVMRIQAPEVP
jgi:hypothetical protein